MTLIKRHPFAAFVVIAYAISWILWSPSFVSGQEILPGAAFLLIIIGGFGPLFSAVIVTWIIEGKAGLREWGSRIFKRRVGIGFYLFALLCPIIAISSAYGFYLLVGGKPADFSSVPPWYLYPLSFLFVFFIGGGQEEPGWRGFALPRLLTSHSPLVASLILGVIWVFWHFPLFFTAAAPQAELPFWWFLLNVVAWAIIFTWLYLNTGGSVLLAMLLHAGLNAVFGFFPMETNVIDPYGYITMVTWIVAIILIVVYGPARFFRSPNNVGSSMK